MGISQDDAATAEKFRESLKLPFPLLGDPDAKVSRAWGVSAGSYAKRVTFVVGPDGKIVHVEHDKLEPSGAITACPLSHRPHSPKPK